MASYSRPLWFSPVNDGTNDRPSSAAGLAEGNERQRDAGRPLTECRSCQARSKALPEKGSRSARGQQEKLQVQKLGLQAPDAIEHQLAHAKRNIQEMTEAISRQGAVADEHRELAALVPDERRKARGRERQLALQLADIDAELDEAKGKLVRAKAKQAAAAAASLRRASKPIALEAAWAASVVECPGKYIIIKTVDVSPRADLLVPSQKEVIGTLEAGKIVQVSEVLRMSHEKRLRGRIIAPLGWISLVDIDNTFRWAEKQASDSTDFEDVPSSSLVQESAELRSSSLRGWRVGADMQTECLQETLQAALCFAGGLSGGHSGLCSRTRQGLKGPENLTNLSLPALSRRLCGAAMNRYFGTMQAEVRSEQMWRDLEVARMELADEESHAAALHFKASVANAKNVELFRINLRLQHLKDKVESGLAFSLHDVPENSADLGPPQSKIDGKLQRPRPAPPRGQGAMFHRTHQVLSDEPKTGLHTPVGHGPATPEVALSASEAGRLQVDMFLRRANELQRQRCERNSEIAELRSRLGPLRWAAAKSFAGIHHAKALCQQRRVQAVLSRLVGIAVEELDVLDKWFPTIEGRTACLLESLGVRSEVLRARSTDAVGEADTGTREVAVATEAEFMSSLRDAMAMFRPCGGVEDSQGPDGARALWSLAAALRALQSYTQVELTELPSVPPKGMNERFASVPPSSRNVPRSWGYSPDHAAENLHAMTSAERSNDPCWTW